MSFIICAILGGIIFGFLTKNIAEQKGRDSTTWFIYGFFFALLAFIHALTLKPNEKAYLDNGYRKCPYCAELVKNEAKICKHCGKEIEPLAVNDMPVERNPVWKWDVNSLPMDLKQQYDDGHYRVCEKCQGITYETGLACPHCGQKFSVADENKAQMGY